MQEAKQLLQQNLVVPQGKSVPLSQALHRMLTEPAYSVVDVPSFDNSAMDGYALCFQEGKPHYTVSQIIQAGDVASHTIQRGEAARIFTGAPIPDGCDTVVQQEYCSVLNGVLTFDETKSHKGQHVRRRGSQNLAGEILAQKNSIITPGLIGLLASAGVASVVVYPAPRVSIIITGNELQEVGTDLAHGHIYNSNQPTLHALLDSVGVRSATSTHVNDDPRQLYGAVQQALANTDVLIVTGGISVGDYDYVQEVLEEAGVQTLFYKVRQKPGKPLFAGRKENSLVFGLPGNPASVITAFNQYVKPCLLAYMGHSKTFMPDGVFRLTDEVNSKRGLTQLLKAKRSGGTITILDGQESFNLKAFSNADSLVVIDEETEYLPVDSFVKTYFL